MSSRAIKGRYHIKKKMGKVTGLSIIAIIVAVMAALAFGAIALANTWLEDLPDYSHADAFGTSSTSTVYASDGKTVLAEFQLENRDPVELDEVSDYVKEATVATEDERFYSHKGIDMYGTARAIVNNLFGGSREGGSTITQQLVRNTILSEEMNEISIKRKLREMFLATKMEEMYDKDEILSMYLNTINYGSGAYGIQAAAQRYYSKDASDLTLDEAATLVGIPQSPTFNNPIDHPENCLKRRNTVLDRMLSNGYISEAEAEQAKAAPIELNTTAPSVTGITQYPYFASYVRNQLLSQNGKYAFSVADLFAGGLEIVTTLDVDCQEAADIAAANKEEEAGEPFEVAMVAIDPDNGYIKAMVGGKDYDNEQVNMATGEGGSGRQCGSTFKAFTYAAAIEAGINPDTIIDAGYSFTPEGAAEVFNVDKHDYGVQPISGALKVSSNTAFMRLAMSVGINEIRDMAQRCGITSNIQNVAGITLGIDSFTPLEMADAYATFANGGIHYNPECIIKITNSKGDVIVDNSNPEGERVISPEVAAAVVKGLEGVISDGTGTAAKLDSDQPVGGKTGTTDDKKDSWFVGITPQLSVAIWLGERADTYSEASRVTSTAASTFADFMNRVLAGKPIEEFPTAGEPDYIKNYVDSKYHIGNGGWSPTTNPDDEEDPDEEEPGNEEPGNTGGTTEEPGESGGNVTPDPPVDPDPGPDPPTPDPEPTPTG